MVSASGSAPTPRAGSERPKALDREESLIAAFERVAATMPSRIAVGSKVWEPGIERNGKSPGAFQQGVLSSRGQSWAHYICLWRKIGECHAT
jgi:hypothetical protein